MLIPFHIFWHWTADLKKKHQSHLSRLWTQSCDILQ